MNNQPIDIVIPCHRKDQDILPFCIAGCRKNVVNLNRIYVICGDLDIRPEDVEIIPENTFFSDGEPSLEAIRRRWQAEYPANANRAGWLFQQFIKLGSCYAIPNLAENYLLLDADVVFLKRVSFFDGDKSLISPSQEYHNTYFDCYERLTGRPAQRQWSFISHHFPVRKSLLREMLDFLEKRFSKPWYEAVLDCIDSRQSACFSEYETIGHFLKQLHPDCLRIRRLFNVQKFNWSGYAKILLRIADYVTIHDYKKPEKDPQTSRFLYNLFIIAILHRLRLRR